MAEWSIAIDCKSIGLSYVGSNPAPTIILVISERSSPLSFVATYNSNITQVVRVSDCGSECRGFKSHYSPYESD